MNKDAFVYALTNQSGEIRYIGSSFNPYHRTRSHCSQASFPVIRSRDTRLVAWLKTERIEGRFPNVLILSSHGSREQAYEAERQLTQRLYNAGVPLLNWIIKGAKRSNWKRHAEQMLGD